ncbi:HsdM family class I SAM-dependent methyltransferase [Natronospora cellulosivora (SeqCode)]
MMIKENYYQLKNQLEKKYYKETSDDERKKKGQFFTPSYIAEFMVDWIMEDYKDSYNILDPALGTGIFLEKIIKKKKHMNFHAYEKDQYLYKLSTDIFPCSDQIKIFNDDYLINWGKKYDTIISNPPYLIYKKYNSKKLIKYFNQKLDINLSGFSNLYILFLLKSLYELKENGRMAYIIPSDFMNADYGVEIKKIIKEFASLRHVIFLNYNIFEPVTSSSILLFENKKIKNKRKISFLNIKSKKEFLNFFEDKDSLNSLNNLNVNNKKSIVLEKIDPEKKWTFYYLRKRKKHYKNLVPLSKYARVHRGIATGANKFFLLNSVEKEARKIKKKYLLPCLSRAIYAKNDFFIKEDWDKLLKEEKKVYLLNAHQEDGQDENIKEYIKYGSRAAYDRRYLTSNRKPWYSIENIAPAEILVKVFNRGKISFIINEAAVYNLTAFHCIYPEKKEYFSLLKAYLLTDLAKDIIEENARTCGNGLKKFEPNDISNSYILDLSIINKKDVEQLLDLYQSYRNRILNKEDIRKHLEKEYISEIFKKYM